MSHFTVLVPADSEAHLEEVLLPYHEYECTGIEEYLEKIDITAELEEDYQRYGEGDETLDEFAEHWNGSKREDDGRFYRITNPNARWDWWTIGGRWSGLLLLKGETPEAGLGSRGLMDSHYAAGPLRADYAPSICIDWEGMAAERLEGNLSNWRSLQDALAVVRRDDFPETFQDMAESPWMQTSVARAADDYNEPGARGDIIRAAFKTERDYVEMTAARAYLSTKNNSHYFGSTFDDLADLFYPTEEEFIQKHKYERLTHAFIDLYGGWNELGKMGWWATINKEVGTEDYDRAYWEFIRSLPGDQTVYVVDCHI